MLKEYSLSYVEVKFVMISNNEGKTECIFECPISEAIADRKERWLRRIESVLGKTVADALEYIEGVHFEGWVSKQLLGKSNTQTIIKRNLLYMYINKRPVDFFRSLSKAIEALYK